MNDERNYRFYDGFNLVEEGKKDFVYIRRREKELAEQMGKTIRCEVHNEYINKWQYVGQTQPDGIFISAFGDRCTLDEDGRGYTIIKD